MRQEKKIRDLKNEVRQLTAEELADDIVPISAMFITYGGNAEAAELLEKMAPEKRDGMWWYVKGLASLDLENPVLADIDNAIVSFSKAIGMGLSDPKLEDNLKKAAAVAAELHDNLTTVTDDERKAMQTFINVAWKDYDKERDKAIEAEKSLSDKAASLFQRQILIAYFNHHEDEEAELFLNRIESNSQTDSRACIWHFFKALFAMRKLDDPITVDNLEKNLEITSLIKDEARKCHEAAHNASLDDGTVEAIHKLLEVSKKMRIAMRTMVKNVGDEFCPEPYIPEHSPID